MIIINIENIEMKCFGYKCLKQKDRLEYPNIIAI